MQTFFGKYQHFLRWGAITGPVGQKDLPLTYLCGLWQLVTAASYIEGDVSVWRLEAAAS